MPGRTLWKFAPSERTELTHAAATTNARPCTRTQSNQHPTKQTITPLTPGAVGTPIWFGLGGIGLGQDNLQLVGLKVAIIIGACAFVITPLAASFLVSEGASGQATDAGSSAAAIRTSQRCTRPGHTGCCPLVQRSTPSSQPSNHCAAANTPNPYNRTPLPSISPGSPPPPPNTHSLLARRHCGCLHGTASLSCCQS